MWRRTGKYNNKKIIIDNIKFDSLKEGAYYQKLKALKSLAAILDFKIKPKELLQEGFVHEGEKIRAIHYIPDFVVYYDKKTEFVDCKGMRTDVFDLKWKMLKYKYRNESGYIFTLT